jgi:hypothetical protein
MIIIIKEVATMYILKLLLRCSACFSNNRLTTTTWMLNNKYIGVLSNNLFNTWTTYLSPSSNTW